MTRGVAISGLRSSVFRIALGTAGFGSSVSRDESFALLDAYASAGGNFLDTANVYAEWLSGGRGMSETTIGAWLDSRGMRSRMIVGTKGGHHDLATGRKRMNPADLDHDLAESLGRLGADRVDLYWFHRDDPAVPVGEILGWAAGQVASGLIGAVGCSNWSLRRLRETNDPARGSPLRFSASQLGWSLAERRALPPEYPDLVYMNDPIRRYHAETGLPVVAYSSQGTGFFSTHKRGDPGLTTAYGTPTNEARRRLADIFAANRGASSNQVALAWLWHHPFPVVPVVGPRTMAQLRDSLGAIPLEMTPAEFAALASPP